MQINKLTKQELVYRQALPGDHEGMMAAGYMAYSPFEKELGQANWAVMKSDLQDGAAFARLLESAISFVCIHKDTVIGVAYLLPHGNATPVFPAEWCYIRKLGVAPAYRGLGIASALMQMCIAHARQTGEKMIALHTAEFQQAWRIYERAGFERIKEIAPIYDKKYWLYTMAL